MNRPARRPHSGEIVDAAAERRRKFDALFTDPRHYRGDCRLARTAIRRGWIKPEDRDAFVDRLNELPCPDYDHSRPLDFNWRRIRGTVYLLLEIGWANEREERYANPFGWPERTTGRPRRRWYVSDYPNRLDAADVRAELLRAGRVNPTAFIDVSHKAPAGPVCSDRVRLLLEGDRSKQRLRVLLICPQCNAWRRHVYLTQSGVACRKCLRLRYCESLKAPIEPPSSPTAPI